MSCPCSPYLLEELHRNVSTAKTTAWDPSVLPPHFKVKASSVCSEMCACFSAYCPCGPQCHVVLVICHYYLGCFLQQPRMLLHHLASMAIQRLHTRLVRSQPALLSFRWDFGHWIAFNKCYFLLTSELIETCFGVTWDIKSLYVFKTEGAAYPTWGLSSVSYWLTLHCLWPQRFHFLVGSWSRPCSWVQVWLHLQDLNLPAGPMVSCVCVMFSSILQSLCPGGHLRLSRICVAFSPIWSHGERLPCQLCSELQQWELYYWKVGICAN